MPLAITVMSSALLNESAEEKTYNNRLADLLDDALLSVLRSQNAQECANCA